MFLKSVTLTLIIVFASSASAQISSALFGAAFPAGFVQPYTDFGAGSTSQYPGESGGRSSTGPILFPPAPESRDTSGVVIGASGYGFVPPGGKGISQGRGIFSPPPPLPASAAFTSSFGSPPFTGSFFHL